MRIHIKRDKRYGSRRYSKDYTKKMYKDIERLWRICVREFIIEAVNSMAGSATIDTGMSAASFSAVAARVRFASRLRGIISGRVKSPAKPGYSSTDYPGLTRFKSRAHGEALGQRAYKMSLGSNSNPHLIFEFDIVVLQHAIHESHWNSLGRGKDKFTETWNRLLPDYVSASDIVRWVIRGY